MAPHRGAKRALAMGLEIISDCTPVSPGAPRGERNGAYKHGLFTKEAKALKARVTLMRRVAKVLGAN